MKLVIGLGNPGREYAGTRHNVGFDVIDALAGQLGWLRRNDGFDQMARAKFDGLVMDGSFSVAGGSEQKLLLLKPATYMNLSGRSVRSAMDFYRLTPEQIMVVLDDIALPVGRLRLRADGSSGGHKGLQDIERALGTKGYPRLRIGVDPPPANVAGRDWVLGHWSVAQAAQIEKMVERACWAIECWIEQGLSTAMNQFNADRDE